METGGKKEASKLGKLISILIILSAIALSIYTYQRYAQHPATDDAAIDAEVVHIAATVGGRIIAIPIAENNLITKGDLLFQIDPAPYKYRVAQIKADLAMARAALETKRRTIVSQQAQQQMTKERVNIAKNALALAELTVNRLQPLVAQGYVPKQQLDQAQTEQRDAVNNLHQAKQNQLAATYAIDTDEEAQANVLAMEAQLASAERDLRETTVFATQNGRVVGLSVLSGETVKPTQALFTLVNNDEWYAVGNFRETDLHAINEGDCITAYSMIDRRIAIKGSVQGIGFGVLNSGKVELPNSVPYVQRSLNWVRVAQRFPVRVRLQDPPIRLMRLGASAIIKVKRGVHCQG